jgi:hypothetical protein
MKTSVGASAGKYGRYSGQKQPEIKTGADVACEDAVHRDAGAIIHVASAAYLPDARQTWLDRKIAGNAMAIARNLSFNDWAWTYDTHLASQHIDELGQFIETRAAQKAAESRDTRIVAQFMVFQPFFPRFGILVQDAGESLFSIHHHRTEFEAVKTATVYTESPMGKKDWAALRGDDDAEQYHRRKKEYQRDGCDRYIQYANDRLVVGGNLKKETVPSLVGNAR